MEQTKEIPLSMASPAPQEEYAHDSTIDRADKHFIRLGRAFVLKHLSGGEDMLSLPEIRALFGLAVHLPEGTNVVMAPRGQMALAIGMRRSDFSEALTKLEDRGIILRFSRPRRIALRAKYLSRLRSRDIREW